MYCTSNTSPKESSSQMLKYWTAYLCPRGVVLQRPENETEFDVLHTDIFIISDILFLSGATFKLLKMLCSRHRLQHYIGLLPVGIPVYFSKLGESQPPHIIHWLQILRVSQTTPLLTNYPFNIVVQLQRVIKDAPGTKKHVMKWNL